MASDKMKLKITQRELFIDYIPTALVAVMIIVFAILKEQSFIKTLPTLITLVVLIMSVRANRYAFILGATNSVLYAIAYLSEGVYFSALSALLISMPIQVLSFFVWSRHKTDKTRCELLRMRWWQLVIATVALFPAWEICYLSLSSFFEGTTARLDSLVFVLGILTSVLVAFRFVEGQYFNLVSCAISLVMWILICLDQPNNVNFAIISVYNLFRTVQAAINWTLLYVKQKKEKQLA